MLRIWSKRAAHGSLSEEEESLKVALQQHEPFQGLSPVELSRLIPAIRFKRFQDEEIVCRCPDASHDAFVLLKGVVALTRRKGDGVYVMQMEKSGAVFNIEALMGLSPEGAGVRALSGVEVLALDSAMVELMLEERPQLGYTFTRTLCRLALKQCHAQLDRYLE